MSVNINELAEKIATLGLAEQEALLEKVAELTFRPWARGALAEVSRAAGARRAVRPENC